MLNKTQQKPLKKQILSHMQQKWQSQILDFFDKTQQNGPTQY